MAQEQKRHDLRAQLDRLGYGAGGKRGRVVSASDLRRAVRKQTPATQAAPPSSPEKPTPAGPIHYGRSVPRSQPNRKHTGSPVSTCKIMLEETLDGSVSRHIDRGCFYLLETPVASLENGDLLNARFPPLLESPTSGLCERLQRSVEPCTITTRDIVFMDIETTGLSSSPLFLIGIMVWTDDGFLVRQFFARNYAEEAAVIATFLDLCRESKLLVTFNGKTYDYPYIRNRSAANGLQFGLDLAHVDLLHESRRIWKHSLPDCKLQTLEAHICGRHRFGDIPGSEIPQAYHDYVRTNDARQMVSALEHNMLDLVTLADLMTHFPPLES